MSYAITDFAVSTSDLNDADATELIKDGCTKPFQPLATSEATEGLGIAALAAAGTSRAGDAKAR